MFIQVSEVLHFASSPFPPPLLGHPPSPPPQPVAPRSLALTFAAFVPSLVGDPWSSAAFLLRSCLCGCR